MDLYYPLPKRNLIARYKPLFDELNKGKHCTFIGLPKSAKSGYLKFLVEEKQILKSILKGNKEKTRIIFLNSTAANQDDILESLLQEIIPKHAHSSKKVSLIERVSLLKAKLQQMKKNKQKIILLLDLRFNKEALSQVENIKLLKDLADSSRTPPQTSLNFVFLCHTFSPFLKPQNDFYKYFADFGIEQDVYFSNLTKEEAKYTIDRLSKLYYSKTFKYNLSEIYEITGGVYPILQNLLRSLDEDLKEITTSGLERIYKEPLIQEVLNDLVNSFSIKQKRILSNLKNRVKHARLEGTLFKLGILNTEGQINSLWLSQYLKLHSQNSISDLTSVEHEIFQKLNENLEEIISRDEIARILWQEKSVENYSEWAIDKSISRLRQKISLSNEEYYIKTHRKRGYSMHKCA